jgi:hypothetical protein
MTRRAWRHGGPIAAAFAVLLGFAGIAAAALSVRSDSVTVAPDQKGSVTAKCPRGSEAVAGGFASPAFDPRFVNASIIHFDSHRTSDREWRTQAHNFGGNMPVKASPTGELDAYAVCDTRSPGLLIRSKTRTVGPGGTKRADSPGVRTLVAKCPKGSEAVSGGFSSPDARAKGRKAAYAFTSKRVRKRGWKVRAANNDFQNQRKIKAYAYCAKHEPGLDVETKHVTVPPGNKATLDIGCRHGEKPLSGGYASTYSPGSGMSTPIAAFAFTSRPISGDRWRVSAFGEGAAAKVGRSSSSSPKGVLGPAARLTAYAYCK